MSDREDEPSDLFDAVCRLDDLADWLEPDYPDQTAAIRKASEQLKGFIVITIRDGR